MKFIYITFFLFFSNNVFSKIIDDGDGVLVNGIRWLDLSVTDGVSYSSLSALFPSYRVASSNEVEEMFSFYATRGDLLFGDVDADYLHDDFSFYNRLGKIGPSPFTFKEASFFNDFGYTFQKSWSSTHGEKIASWGVSIAADKSLEYSGLYTYTPAITDYRYGEESYNRAVGEVIKPNWDYSNPNLGWFMVETSTIPEPSVFYLMGLGFAGFGFTLWRKRQTLNQ